MIELAEMREKITKKLDDLEYWSIQEVLYSLTPDEKKHARQRIAEIKADIVAQFEGIERGKAA